MSGIRRGSSLLMLFVLLSAAAIGATPAVASNGEIHQSERAVPGHYIVALRDGAGRGLPDVASDIARDYGGTLRFVYRHAFMGFSIQMIEARAFALSRDPRVAYVEEDGLVTADATQTNATWGLDRVDQRDLPLNGTYTYNTTGSGVNGYIIDTGIRGTHQEFGGRALVGYDAVGDGQNTSDCNGHGTHVAGTVGGNTYGVAKAITLYAVRVLDCNGNGTTSGVIAGVDWVTGHHASGTPAVANMSLIGGASSSLDTAVNNSIADGVTYSVAAGNGNFIGIAQNACNYSPARVPEALTVSATNNTDKKASWANYGSCLDLFAPGVGITSAWNGSDAGTNTISGTSMATPHVAGTAALYLEANPSATPAAVAQAITDNATPNKVSSAGSGSPNRLLYTGFIGGGGSTNNPPTASFTPSCAGLTCSFTDTSTDSDGTVVSWSWTFGDGASATQQHPSHTYGSGGTYSVTLTVTDNGGATGNTSQNVTVSDSSSGITLSVTGYKVKGLQKVDLTWSGATSTGVDVFRNGSKVATTTNDGFYTDNIDRRGGGTYTFKVCEAGTPTCSNESTVVF